MVEKAFAYITRDDALLVFRHPNAPEAGIQVPAGTIRPDETPESAVMREAQEETWLKSLSLVRPLGSVDIDMSEFGIEGIHRRHFFHLRLSEPAPSTWQHYEHDASNGITDPILFEFFWVRVPEEVPPLIAGHGRFIDELVRAMNDPL